MAPPTLTLTDGRSALGETTPRVQPARRRARPCAPSSSPAPVLAPSPHELDPGEVQRLIELIVEPLRAGETFSAGYDRKECALGQRFAQLTVLQAWLLHRRLSCAVAGDPLAAAFGRLVVERRARLLVFLADARRRAARAG